MQETGIAEAVPSLFYNLNIFYESVMQSSYSKPPLTERLRDIDAAKGLAIVLVVFGHLADTSSPVASAWYLQVKELLYLFHMPFFMFLSGILLGHGKPPPKTISTYLIETKKKAKRLLPAYFLFMVIIWLGKIVAQHWFTVENEATFSLSQLVNAVAYPKLSYVGYLWFLPALFLCHAIYPILINSLKSPLWVVFVGVVIQFLPTTSLFAIDMVFELFVFFSVGTIVGSDYSNFGRLTDRYGALCLVGFGVSIIAVGYLDEFPVWLVPWLSLPALMTLIRKVPEKWANLLELIGKYTFPIYLMNMIFSGTAKAAFLFFLPKDEYFFNISVPLLFLSGLLLPIAMKLWVFSHIKWLNKVTS